MDLYGLEIKLREIADEAKDFTENKAPEIIGKMAKDFYKESFQDEGFTDDKLEPWKEVKRREAPRRPDHADATRKILTGRTGNLGRSIEYLPSKGEVTILSEVYSPKGFNYAPVHNFGTDKTPKRQFVGESETLNRQLYEEMERRISDIINNSLMLIIVIDMQIAVVF